MNWQYFPSGRSSQLRTALMKTQRGDQWRVLEGAWTHNGAIKSKSSLNTGLSQGSKELLQHSAYLLVKVLVFIMLLRTKDQCWYLVVLFPQLCYHHQELRHVPQQKQTNKKKSGLSHLPQLHGLKQEHCRVICVVSSSLPQKKGAHLLVTVLACTAHFSTLFKKSTRNSALRCCRTEPQFVWSQRGK